MDSFSFIFIALFVIVAGRFVYGRIKHGSWTGSFLKGRIDQTLGEVTLSSGLMTHTVAVHSMRADAGENDFVVLVVVSRAPLAAAMRPYKLTKQQARDLAHYLAQASK